MGIDISYHGTHRCISGKLKVELGMQMDQVFKYNTKMKRQIILEEEHKEIATQKYWIQEGISERRLDKF